MESKRTDRVWAISLIVVGIATVILVGAGFFELRLPDIVGRGIGWLDLAALFTLALSIAKKIIKRTLTKLQL